MALSLNVNEHTSDIAREALAIFDSVATGAKRNWRASKAHRPKACPLEYAHHREGRSEAQWKSAARYSTVTRSCRGEPALLWVIAADESDNITTFYISRFAPSGLRDSKVRFCQLQRSSRSPRVTAPRRVYRSAGRLLEVLERTVFHAEALPVGYSTRYSRQMARRPSLSPHCYGCFPSAMPPQMRWTRLSGCS
jgi:hypothetical protein